MSELQASWLKVTGGFAFRLVHGDCDTPSIKVGERCDCEEYELRHNGSEYYFAHIEPPETAHRRMEPFAA